MSDRAVIHIDASRGWVSANGKLFLEGERVDPKELHWATRFWAWLLYNRSGEWRVQGGAPRYGSWESKKLAGPVETYRAAPELMVDQEVGFSILNEATAYDAERARVEERAKPPTSSKICDGCGESLVGCWAPDEAECYDRKDGWIGHRHKLGRCREKTDRDARERGEAPLNAFVKNIVDNYGHAAITWGEDDEKPKHNRPKPPPVSRPGPGTRRDGGTSGTGPR